MRPNRRLVSLTTIRGRSRCAGSTRHGSSARRRRVATRAGSSVATTSSLPSSSCAPAPRVSARAQLRAKGRDAAPAAFTRRHRRAPHGRNAWCRGRASSLARPRTVAGRRSIASRGCVSSVSTGDRARGGSGGAGRGSELVTYTHTVHCTSIHT